MSTRSVRILMLIQMNYHQYLENYTLKKIEDIDNQIINKQRESKTADTYARVSEANGQAERAQGGCLGTKGRRKT